MCLFVLAHTCLFPMGTFRRDQVATHFFYDINLRKWLRWFSFSDTDEAVETVDTNFKINLCSEILGFRGLVCFTDLTNWLKEAEFTEDLFSTISSVDSHENFQILKHFASLDRQANLNSLVLVGKPDKNKQASSGIWFYDPIVKFKSDDNLFDSTHPSFMLPTAIVQALGQSSLPALVVLTNWIHMTQVLDPVNFPSEHSKKPITCDTPSGELYSNLDNLCDSD